MELTTSQSSMLDGTAIWARRSITLRRQAEVALQLVEKAQGLLVNSWPRSLEIFRPDGQLLHANTAWQELWQTPFSVLCNYNMLQDADIQSKYVWPFIRKGFQGQASLTPEIYFDPNTCGKPGRGRWTDGCIYPVFKDAGKIACVIITLNDLTESRMAAQQLADLRHQMQVLQLQHVAIAERASDITALEDNLYEPLRRSFEERYPGLSRRERDVACMLVQGKSPKEVAYHLAVGVKTVYTYRERLRQKLGLQHESELTSKAIHRLLFSSAG